MSQENVKKLIALSGRDEPLRVRIEQICNDPAALSIGWIAERIAALATEYNLPFPAQAFVDYVDTQSGELTDNDLDSVVGGLHGLTVTGFSPATFALALGGYSSFGMARG